MHEMVSQLPDDKPVVFVVGAFAHGKIDAPWVSQPCCIVLNLCRSHRKYALFFWWIWRQIMLKSHRPFWQCLVNKKKAYFYACLLLELYRWTKRSVSLNTHCPLPTAWLG